MKHLFLAFLIILSFQAHSEVYTWKNSEGVTVYGDEPPANANKATLPILQTISHKKVAKPLDETKASDTPAKSTENEFVGYDMLKILYPKEDDMIVAGQAGTASVQLHISPELQPGHEISIFLDGKKIESGPKLSFEIKNIFRGSHLLQAKIKVNGRLLISSPKRRIHVQRPSILNR